MTLTIGQWRNEEIERMHLENFRALSQNNLMSVESNNKNIRAYILYAFILCLDISFLLDFTNELTMIVEKFFLKLAFNTG